MYKLAKVKSVHQCNFEMAYDEYKDFYRRTENSGSKSLLFSRPVALKAFEKLVDISMLKAVEGVSSKGPKEFRLVKCLLESSEIQAMLKALDSCPQSIVGW